MATRSRRSRSRTKKSPSKTRQNGEKREEDGKAKKSRLVRRTTTPGNISEEGFFDFLYEPHTITALVLMIAWVTRNSFFVRVSESEEDAANLRNGLFVACGVFLFYCMVQLRDGILLRPHPAVWRVVHGFGILYLLLLVFLLSQSEAGVTKTLRLFDKRVGYIGVPKTYGEDCRLYIPRNESSDASESHNPFSNILHGVFDRFFVAHFLGWLLKALIFRDWWLMWMGSLLFEVMEVSFQHLFPNFNECWWDHLFLDVLGCNFLGMATGMYIVRRLEQRQWDWSGLNMASQMGITGKMKRVALQFAPRRWTIYKWQVFSTWRRMNTSMVVAALLTVGELNSFFLKSVLLIPIDSDVNMVRLAIMAAQTYTAVHDFYILAQGRVHRMGANAWLTSAIVSLEFMLVGKHVVQRKMFASYAPAPYIIYCWSGTFALLALLMLNKFLRMLYLWAWAGEEITGEKIISKRIPQSGSQIQEKHKRMFFAGYEVLNRTTQVLTLSLPLPFLIMLIIDCWRTFAHHPPPVPGVTPGW